MLALRTDIDFQVLSTTRATSLASLPAFIFIKNVGMKVIKYPNQFFQAKPTQIAVFKDKKKAKPRTNKNAVVYT